MSRSLKVAPEYIDKVKLAKKRNGFLRDADLANESGISRATVSSFLNGKPVDSSNFVDLCHILGLDWREIAGLSLQSSQTKELSITNDQSQQSEINSPQQLPKQSVSDGNRLYNALIRLNYTGQVPLFRTIVENYPISACLIHGEEESGQKWLLNRLIQLVPNGTVAQVARVSLLRKSRAMNIKTFWRELGGRVGLIGQSSPSNIIEKVAEWYKTNAVILIFDHFQEMPEEFKNQVFCEFWLPLVKSLRDCIPQPKFRLVMFIVDHSGCVEEWNINFAEAETIDSNWEPHIPIRLPKITQICEIDLISWIENSLDELPLKFNTQIEQRVREILDDSEQILPQIALERICELCDCNWYEWEDIWLKH